MDELGSNVADRASDDATSEMSGPVASATADLRKRRSIRIVQAVPLAVTGVDALGRPFTERTSTLIINCHGCRYQSKHYVLKNMWVNLEVPHPESGQPARTVRGRVAWIQRPKTVRQLFQVALELEIPGNVWGIGFPPEDWFAFPDAEEARAAAAEAQARAATAAEDVRAEQGRAAAAGEQARAAGIMHQGSVDTPHAGRVELPANAYAVGEAALHDTTPSESDFRLTLSDEGASSPSAGNLRSFPAPASPTDASLQLARQVTRLLAEARQQIQAVAREAAAQAVAAERRISAEEWEHRVTSAHEQLSRELAAAIEKIEEEVTARSRAAQDAAAEALQHDLPRWLAPQLEELARDLTAQLSQEALALRKAQTEQIGEAAQGLRDLCREAEELTVRLRETAAEAETENARRVDAISRSMEQAAREHEENLAARQHALNAAALETEKRLNAALESAQTRWQNYLTGEMEATQARAQIGIDSALAEAQSRGANGLGEHANGLLGAFSQEAERLGAEFREAARASSGETVRQLQELADSARVQTERLEIALGRAEESAKQLENFAERVGAAQQQALRDFQSQIDDVLSLHRNELHRRSDSLFDEINARIRATFEDSAQQAVAEFQQQAQSIIQPDLVKVDEAVHRLAGGRSLLEAATSLQQERIRTTADEAFAEALAQFRGNLGSVEQLLRASADAVVAKSVADLESRAESAKHEAIEHLLKSAEWYEKKAQTQMQHLGEKAGDQAAAQLRDKAAEISSAFAGELTNASRSFITHAQTQMEDVVRDSFDRARALFSEAAETTSAAFIDEIQRQAREELRGFETEVQKSASDTRTQMEAARADLAQQVTVEQESFLRRFQSAIKGEMENGVLEMNQRVQLGFGPLLEYWKSIADGQQAEIREVYAKVGEEAVEGYRSRLENISKQWMLATVASLDHQSRNVVAAISTSAEQTVRDTCTKAFAEMGESLRERLRQIAGGFTASASHPSQ
jgi:hypothetical protein